MEITLDFTGSENVKIENQSDLVATGVVKPMTSQIIAVLRAYDLQWNTQCKIKLKKGSPSIEDQERFIKEDAERLRQDIEKAKVDWKNFPITISTHDQVLAHIRKTGTNFIDVSFPPVERSICDPTKG